MSNRPKIKKKKGIVFHVPPSGGMRCACGKCNLDGEWYPPHTHGLGDIGLPELLLMHGDFTPRDSGVILDATATFLKESAEVLAAIRDGNAIEVPMEDLAGPTSSGYKFDAIFKYLYAAEPLVQEAYPDAVDGEYIGICVHQRNTRH